MTNKSHRKSTKLFTEKSIFRTAIAISIIIFLIDLYTPRGIADGILYEFVIILMLSFPNKRKFNFLRVWTISLIITGYLLSPNGVGEYIAITNRVFSVLTILVTYYLIIRHHSNLEKLEEQRNELVDLNREIKLSNIDLEERIKNRTEVIEETLLNIEETNNKLKESLEKEKELSELKSRFVAMASHEFRTPLTTMLTSLSLVSKYGELGQKENQENHINKIKTSILYLTSILNDVLSLSKLEENKISTSKEVFTINEFVSDIIQEMKLMTDLNQAIEYNHEGVTELLFDKNILKQVFFNIVSNAIKYSDHTKTIKINTKINDSTFFISVEDQGIGMAIEDQKHLFERFYRGSNVANIEGTGLGLSIVAKQVALLNGTIECNSVLGKGTTFYINFNLN